MAHLPKIGCGCSFWLWGAFLNIANVLLHAFRTNLFSVCACACVWAGVRACVRASVQSGMSTELFFSFLFTLFFSRSLLSSYLDYLRILIKPCRHLRFYFNGHNNRKWVSSGTFFVLYFAFMPSIYILINFNGRSLKDCVIERKINKGKPILGVRKKKLIG